MELSGQTLANWQSKVAHLLLEIGVQPGDHVGLVAQPGWQPAVIAIGAWHVGAVITDTTVGDPFADVLFTDDLAHAEASPASEVYLLSDDPFGRGVEESGKEVPFGINDFSPEVRIHPDQFHGATQDGPELALGVKAEEAFGADASDGTVNSADVDPDLQYPSPDDAALRIVTGPWSDAASLARTLFPLLRGGSVVMSTDTAGDRLDVLAAREHAVVA